MERLDNFYNPVNGFNTESSSIQNTTFGSRLILGRNELEALYQSDGNAANAIDIPANEMWRAGVDFFMVDGTESDLPAKIDQELERLEWLTENTKATKDAWKMGGAGLVMLMDDGKEYREPVDKTKGIKRIHEADRWAVIPTQWEQDIYSENYGKPILYKTSITYTSTAMSVEAHPDRIITFRPPFTGQFNEARYNMGWGEPRFTRVYNRLRQMAVGVDTGAEAFQKFWQYVLKSPDLKKWAAKGDDSMLAGMKKRLSALFQSWGINKLAVINAGEEFEVSNIPITGLVELIEMYPQFFSSAAQVPFSRLFTGKGGDLSGNVMTGDELNFMHTVQGWQREARPVVKQWLRLLSTYMGFDPESIGFTFNPLFQPTELEQAQTRKSVAETDQLYIMNGVMTPLEIRDSRAVEKGMPDFTSYIGDAAGRKDLEELEEMNRDQMENDTPQLDDNQKDKDDKGQED
jgi:phage-related protein (TIGR01555 family)